ncbi:MAG: coproporphyrinogen dehydrogenase HemZ [Selenomonadaceae bacterium]|nr:coproporphyrinogen dehydrogenase HemZ [Selenomonadaceae bacterium]
MKIKNFKLNSDAQVIHKVTWEVLRAFHIELADSDDAADFDAFQISNDVTGKKVLTRLTVKNSGGVQTFQKADVINREERRGAEINRIIKKNLYTILTRDLKLRGVPYGIMHGVRPVKIVHRWLKDKFAVTNHGVIDRDKIARRLRADYLTNYEKSLLLTEVALRQIPILNSSDDKTVSVYIGIPFCVTRCLYCSFPSNVLPAADKVAAFMEILTRDIDAAAAEVERYGFNVQNIYIGGGTPSSLPIKFFRELLEKVTQKFYRDTKEFTVECGRPDTVDDDKIAAMKDFHVNRVCLNPQTMQQKTLDRIGRRHSVEQFLTAFEKLRQAADWKINTDLILGLPGENFDDAQDSLQKVLALNPDDITLHALALKRGSKLQTQIADEVHSLADFNLPSDEEVIKMSDAAEKILRGKNYLPYYLYRQGYISGQIENIAYCKRGAECIYNVQIMNEQQVILGIGPAASTKVPDKKESRLQTSYNAKDLTTYLRDIDKYISNRSKVLAQVYS